MARVSHPRRHPGFPHRGKKFSTVWKKTAPFFHGVEKTGPTFPQCGKLFSIAWIHSEKVFHGVESAEGRAA
jgi:hypothetical protein